MEELKEMPWRRMCNRFVVFLDIMGFKDMVTRKSHDEIYKLLDGFSIMSDEIKDKPFLKKDIYISTFSDSIVIFSKDGNVKTLFNFLFVVNKIFADAISREIPLKGSVAYGEISVNKSKSIFFGQPIIDAYLLQEEVYYYGVVCHNSIDNYLSDQNDSELKKIFIEDNSILSLVKASLKGGEITHLCLNWFDYIPNVQSDKKAKIENIDVIKRLYGGVSGMPRKYIDNTINIYHKVKEMQKENQDCKTTADDIIKVQN